MSVVFLLVLSLLLFVDSSAESPESKPAVESPWTATLPNGCQVNGILKNAGKGTSVVLIISGSGPTDRNGNSPNAMNNSLQMLADSLAIMGVSSLRYDKRFLSSKENCQTPESDLRFEMMAEDAAVLTEALAVSGNFNKIYILGHSEGSLVGLLASKMVAVDGFISIAGSGQPADEMLVQQLSKQLPPDELNTTKKIFEALKKGSIVDTINPTLYPILRPSVQPYIMSWIAYNPAEEIENVSGMGIPVLIIDGGNDIQVGTEQGDELARASGTLKVSFSKMTHVLKEAEINDINSNMATYHNPTIPLQIGLADVIVSFIKAN